MAKLRETHPEMSYHIDQTMLNVGLRLPTPSPSQSPANSARSSSSRTSSVRSVGSKHSARGSLTSNRSENEVKKINQGIQILTTENYRIFSIVTMIFLINTIM